LGGCDVTLTVLGKVPATEAANAVQDVNDDMQAPLEVEVPLHGKTRDGDGVAEVKDLVPGLYRITVRSLNAYVSITRVLEVREGETTTTQVVLEPDVVTSVKIVVRNARG
jgi:hypothetical protein